MSLHFFIAIATLSALFILFMVIGKTVNNILNQLTRIEYFLRKEIEYHQEAIEIARVLEAQHEEDARQKKS